MEAELEKPTHAAFREELKLLVEDLTKRFDAYLKIDFLIVSSLLDPRYTKQIEHLFGKTFNDFIPKILELSQVNGTENEYSIEVANQLNVDDSLQSLNGFQFWDNSESNFSQTDVEIEVEKDSIEVIK